MFEINANNDLVYIVYQCPFYWTLGLYGLKKKIKKSNNLFRKSRAKCHLTLQACQKYEFQRQKT